MSTLFRMGIGRRVGIGRIPAPFVNHQPNRDKPLPGNDLGMEPPPVCVDSDHLSLKNECALPGIVVRSSDTAVCSHYNNKRLEDLLKTSTAVLLSFFAAVGLGAIPLSQGWGGGGHQPPPPTPFLGGSMACIELPAGLTPGQMLDIHRNYNLGTPLPHGAILHPNQGGEAKVTLTGLTNAVTGAKQAVVTIQEDSHTDLQIGRVFIDGTLKRVATVGNGRIDQLAGNVSVATMSIWLPASYPFNLEIEWENSLGQPFRYTYQM